MDVLRCRRIMTLMAVAVLIISVMYISTVLYLIQKHLQHGYYCFTNSWWFIRNKCKFSLNIHLMIIKF